MDNSKINQTELKYSCGAGEASVNLYTGRMLFEHPDISIGANSFQIGISHIYNSMGYSLPSGINAYMGTNWKLNMQQYLYKDGTTKYIYIDGAGFRHEFEKLDGNQWYDTSGLNLILEVGTSENIVSDQLGNKMYFADNRLIKSESCHDATMIKYYKYIDGKLIEIYDDRKSQNKLLLDYYQTTGLLKTITCKQGSTVKQAITYFYDSVGKIMYITKTAYVNGVADEKKNITFFNYNINSQIEYVTDLESKTSLNFAYHPTGEVKNILTGALSEANNGTVQISFPTICGQVICGQAKVGYDLTRYDFNQKNANTIEYPNPYHRTVTNEKTIKLVYHFNVKGFTTGIFEEIGTEIFRTLTKTNGWALADSGNCSTKINGKNAYEISNALTIPGSKFNPSNNGIFSNGINDPKDYQDHFAVSFWARLRSESSNGIKAKFAYTTRPAYKTNGSTTFYTFTNNYYGRLDNTAINSWQYVTIPVRFDENQLNNVPEFQQKGEYINPIKKDIQSASLSFEGYGGQIDIADLRIAVGNIDSTFIANVDFSKATELGSDYNTGKAITSDNFMTESDLFLTYKNLYHKNRLNQTYFGMVYCGGTKVKLVTSVWFKINNIQYTLSVDGEGIPNYYNISRNRTENSTWCITQIQKRFHDNGTYYEQKIAVDFVNSINATASNNASNSYTWTNADGTHRAAKNAYNVLTHNYYDGYGNLTSIETYEDNNQNAERLKMVFGYGNIAKSQRENPQTIIENGITKTLSFNEPFMQPNISKVLGGNPEAYEKQYDYDSFCKRLLSTSAMNRTSILSKNSFSYDLNGRLQSLSDQKGHNYSFEYNVFGEASKFFENNNLILTKSADRNQNDIAVPGKGALNNIDVITEQRYRQNNPDKTEVFIDKYGRLLATKVNNSLEVKYTYQDANSSFGESPTTAKVAQIIDPFSEQTFEYRYDNDNMPYEYKSSAGNGTFTTGDGKYMRVTQISENETEYSFDAGNNTLGMHVVTINHQDTVKADNKNIYIAPRVIETKDGSYMEYNKTYSYDGLGRIETIQSALKDSSIGTRGSNISQKKEYKKRIINNIVHATTSVEKLTHTVYGEFVRHNGISVVPYSYSADFTQSYEYDQRGNVTGMSELGLMYNYDNPSYGNSTANVTLNKNYNYQYDSQDRVIKDQCSGSHTHYYNYNYDAQGNLFTVTNQNQVILKKFNYVNGRKSSYYLDNVYKYVNYDSYGNVTSHDGVVFRWDSRNLLAEYGYGSSSKSHEYFYNHQGVRYKKVRTDGTKTIVYYLDGSRILAEDVNGARQFSYRYDAEGICGLRYNEKQYTFIRDGLGNISKVLRLNKAVGEYIYDAWGNCTVVAFSNNTADDTYVLNNNPFRWKAYYCDLESSFYYINGRYYDPVIMQYLDAESPEKILLNATTLKALDRHEVIVDNILALIPNLENVFTVTELAVNPSGNATIGQGESQWKTWWRRNWKKVVAGVIFVTAIILMCIPGTQAFGMGLMIAAISGGVSGVIIGGVIGGIISAVQGNGFIEGACQGAVDNFLNGFITSALLYCMTTGISAAVNAANKAKVVEAAKAAQLKGGYAVDDWVGIKLSKGEVVWGGTPGQTSFYTTDGAIQAIGNDGTKIFEGLQVAKHSEKGYRAGMTMYEVTKNTYAASSIALANTKHGAGALAQFFIPAYKDTLSPVFTLILAY